MAQYVMGADGVVQMVPDGQNTSVAQNYGGNQNSFSGPGWQVVNGVIYAQPGAQVPQDVQGAYRMASPAEYANAVNPHGVGNGEGGSDLSNIAMGLGFIGGGAALTGGLGGLFGSTSAVPTAGASEVGTNMASNGGWFGAGPGYTVAGDAGAGGLGTSGVNTGLGSGLTSGVGSDTLGSGISLTGSPQATSIGGLGAGVAGAGTGAMTSAGGALGSGLANAGDFALTGSNLVSSGGLGTLGTAGAGISAASSALGGSSNSSYQFPWGNAVGSLIGAAGAASNANTLADAMKSATAAADPFASQRGFYQDQLKSMYTDPNYFSNSPVMKGLTDTALDTSQRKLASQGYNYSGNTQSELAKLATNTAYTYAQNQQDMTAKAAGAYNGPGAAGTVAAQGALAQPGLNSQLYGNLGAGVQSVINGAQPTSAQNLTGTPMNQSLADVVKGYSL